LHRYRRKYKLSDLAILFNVSLRSFISTIKILTLGEGGRGKGKRGKGKGEGGNGKEKTFNLFAKPNYELKMQKASSIALPIACYKIYFGCLA